MAHLAWALAAISASAIPPDFDIRSTMSITGTRRNSITWSDSSTLVDLPAVSPEFTRPASSPQQTSSPVSPYAPAPARGLITDWSEPWPSSSPTGDDTRLSPDGDRKKRKRVVQAWLKVKTRLIGAKAGGALGDGGELHSPSSPPPGAVERQFEPPPSRAPRREQVHFSPHPVGNNNRRRMTEYRPRRSASFTISSNPARHSWHSSSSSGRTPSSPSAVEMVWGSMAAGFIM